MNFKNIIVLLVLSIILFGCGKVEPPTEETQTVKVKPKSNYTLDNGVKDKKDLIANVTVVDAETGIAIEGARVRGRIDADDQNAKFIEGIELDDGGYYLPIEELKGSFYVGASAKDYPGNASYTPSFPYEIRLTSGETVTVSGEIIDEFHRPVTRGIMNLRVDKDWGKQWPKFYLNSEKINQHGKFRLENIPANVKDVYAKYECAQERIADLKDQAFDIEYEDIYLRLQLPPKTVINGQVLFPSGNAVSGAWVWVEKIDGEDLDSWNKLSIDKKRALDKVIFCTQADGEFELEYQQIQDKYVVKAYHPAYLPAYKGPYSDDMLPPEIVDLTINNEGARLVGRMFNNSGQPVTNGTASYSINEKFNYKKTAIFLDIDENGEYISGIIPAGIEYVAFQAPGYYDESRPVSIIGNKPTIVDVKFYSESIIITGTVYDAESKLPLAGVTVKSGREEDKEIHTTDGSGKFCFKISAHEFEFSAPGYATFLRSYTVRPPSYYNSHEEFRNDYNPKFYMSPSGTIRLIVNDQNGQPLTGNKVYMKYCGSRAHIRVNNNNKLQNGELLFTNLLSHIPSVSFTVKDLRKRRDLIIIKNVKIKAGEEVVVCTNLPPTGTLILEFENPFDKENINIRVEQILENEDSMFNNWDNSIRFNDYNFKQEGQSLVLNDIPVNEYSLYVDQRPNLQPYLSTNIHIVADDIITFKINNSQEKEPERGVIKGSLKTISGQKIPYRAQVRSQTEIRSFCYDATSYDGNFVIKKLPKNCLYTLCLWVGGNITNMTIKDLQPDGPSIDIVLPDAYAVTGNVIDENGNLLKARAGIKWASKAANGEFNIYPVFPGKYKVLIKAQGYAQVFKEVTVDNSDVDLGDIVITDKGLKISGRVVDSNNTPLQDYWISIRLEPEEIMNTKSLDYGGFSFSGIKSGAKVKLKTENYEKDLGVVSSDLDLGDIVIDKKAKVSSWY